MYSIISDRTTPASCLWHIGFTHWDPARRIVSWYQYYSASWSGYILSTKSG